MVASTAAAAAWRTLARDAAMLAGTPCFVLSASEVRKALDTLVAVPSKLPRRYWLSLKTQPVKALLALWRDWGHGVEVVSDYELAAALATGVPPERILVNGVGKQRWLAGSAVRGLRVHFDSLMEVDTLADRAACLEWRVGLRCQVPNQTDPDEPWRLDQFGLTITEVVAACARLRARGLTVSGVHFHIHSHVRHASEFTVALNHLRDVCRVAEMAPEYVDVGGGLPAAGERSLDGEPLDGAFDLRAWGVALDAVPDLFPTAREVWVENGRYLTARAGALVVTVLDRKDRGESGYLICDGGRINHARMAALAQHDILVDPVRSEPLRRFTICGPTCAAVDRLADVFLPDGIRPGDTVLWMNAGAYHIPLETRFSFGLAPVVWYDEHYRARVVRARETTAEWWERWQ